jgi:hypothetical protein
MPAAMAVVAVGMMKEVVVASLAVERIFFGQAQPPSMET